MININIINNIKSILFKKNLLRFIRRKIKEFFFFIKGVDFFVTEYIDPVHFNPLYPPEYKASNGEFLFKVLKCLKINNNSIIDFGSGKGYALYIMTKFPFKQISGVEISSKFYSIAKNNFSILKIKNINLFLMNAAEFTALDQYDMFYFYNPFDATVFSPVIHNIIQSINNKPRKVEIIYASEVCHDLIMNTNKFFVSHHFYNNGQHILTIYSNSYHDKKIIKHHYF